MKITLTVILISLFGGFLVWVTDSALDALFFSKQSFLEILITDVPERKLFIRISLILYFFLFSSVITAYAKRQEKVQEELEDYEVKFRNIAEQTYDWVFWRNKDGSYKYLSAAFERITGYLKEDLIDNPDLIKKFIHPDDLTRVEKHLLAETKNTLEVSQLDFRILTQNNETKFLKHTCQPIYDKKGSFIGTRGSNIEIPDSKKDLPNESRELAERIKELNCLYKISRYMIKPKCTVEEILQKTADTLPGSWQYPDITGARITYNTSTYSSGNWKEKQWIQSSDITCGDGILGKIEVSYAEEKPELDEGPFLKEERDLIDAVGILLGDFIIRKQVESSLTESEEKFRAISESAQDAIITINNNGTVTFWNKAAEKIFGFTSAEMMGKELHKTIVPEHYLEIYKEGFEKFKKTGKGEAIGKLLELTALRKGGDEFPIELSLSAIKLNNSWNAIAILRDITERKQIEKKLEESEQRFRSLYENSTLGILRSAPDGKIIMANPSAISILGYSSEDELLNLDVNDRYTDLSERGRFKEIVEQEGIVHGYEFKWKRKDGVVIDIRESARFEPGRDGSAPYYEVVIEDITEKRKMEEALISAKEDAEEMNRLKSNLLANMSHELRTPLSGILGFAEMLEEEIEDPVHKELINSIHVSGLRLLSTINSLLNLSKLESENVETNLKEIDICGFIRRMADIYKEGAASKNLRFEVEIKIKHLKAKLDENLLNQILINLISNAVAYTNIGKITVRVDGERSDGINWGVISVQDTGIGISAEGQEYIFDAFRQASEGLSRTYEGAGIGLTLVKRYVELMNGKIAVDSEYGKGSTFSVKFPLTGNGVVLQKNAEVESVIDKNIMESSNLVSKVLLVENERASVEITKYFLKDLCIVESVDNGRDALIMLIEKPYDAVIMDIDLTGEMDGLETTREIRKLPAYKFTPILALTAYAMNGDKKKCLDAGCNDYLAKPVRRDTLVKIMTKLLVSANKHPQQTKI